MTLPIPLYIEHFVRIWEECPENLPLFHRSYSTEEQQTREDRFSRLSEWLKNSHSNRNFREIRKSDPGKSFFPVFRSFLENVFDYEPDQLEIILSDEFRNVSKDFFYHARAFGPELSPENIYQGMRNVWIMNGLQLMMDIPVEITHSVFAYSMIYPYSDNLLDDPGISGEGKKEFSRRFSRCLHGEHVKSQNHTESQLFRLAGMFEQQFPRDAFPAVYQSLYAIHQAQTRSLKLINNDGLSGTAVREICFEKGGASVLADGYLVAGRLTSEQEQALFGYGIYLQLLDDIQDVKEDTEAHTRTLFSCPNGLVRPEAFVNRTIHFGRRALEELRCFKGAKTETMLRLMNYSIEMMILESIGLTPSSYSGGYPETLERYSPLRFEFLRQKRSQSGSQRFAVFKKYFGQASKHITPQKNSITI
jgi:hypothetical protein